MDLQKGFPKVERPMEDVIDALTTCCICGGKLVFKHETDFATFKVVEKATCPTCGIKTKENAFILH